MLAQQQIEEFEKNGYLAIEELVPIEAVLNPLRAEYTDRLRTLCRRWVREKKLPAAAASGDMNQMVMSASGAGIDFHQPLDISLPLGAIQSHTPFHAGPAVFDLITHPKLLDAVQSLIGPEITSNPIQHVHIKPPLATLQGRQSAAHTAATNWHQDRGVTLDADNSRMLTVWLAVTEATENNGCLQVMPGSHKHPMLAHQPASSQCYICPSELNDKIDHNQAVAVPVPAGGGVIFHPNVIHSSLENHSNRIRWGFDLRYNVTGDPTGRECFPSFVARSEADPESVLTLSHTWRQLWEDTRDRLSNDTPARAHRWTSKDELSA